MTKQTVGVVKGRSDKIDDISLRDQIVDGEGIPLEDSKTPIETPEKPQKPPGEMEKLLRDFGTRPGEKKLDRRVPINYFGALDDIIADIYEKQAGAYKIVKAVTQLFESRGQEVPFEEERFNIICGKLAMIQSVREIAQLYGLGLEHSDRVAELMIEKMFGPMKGK